MSQRCVNCTKILDDQTPVESGRPAPKPGDISICFYCANVMTYDSNLQLVTMPDEVKEEIISQYPETYILINKVVKGILERIEQN